MFEKYVLLTYQSMFLRPPFKEQDKQKILAFLKSQSFATLVTTNGTDAPIASHLPVDILPDKEAIYGQKVITHIANGNPQLPLFLNGSEVLIIFLSHTNYISPSWIGNNKSAPTQSHIAVHTYGKAKVVTDAKQLFELMAHQVKTREDSIGQSWSISELGEEGVKSRFKQITGVEIKLDRVEASFRLLQDESKQNIKDVLNNATLDEGLRAEIARVNDIDSKP